MKHLLLFVLCVIFITSIDNVITAQEVSPQVTVLSDTGKYALSVQLPDGNQTTIDLPGAISLEPSKLIEWWQFIYALLTPLGVWLFASFWPSSTKKELVTKATSIAVVILVIVLTFKGFTIATLGQAVIALIMQVFVYDKIYQPIGLSSYKPKSYKKE